MSVIPLCFIGVVAVYLVLWGHAKERKALDRTIMILFALILVLSVVYLIYNSYAEGKKDGGIGKPILHKDMVAGNTYEVLSVMKMKVLVPNSAPEEAYLLRMHCPQLKDDLIGRFYLITAKEFEQSIGGEPKVEDWYITKAYGGDLPYLDRMRHPREIK